MKLRSAIGMVSICIVTAACDEPQPYVPTPHVHHLRQTFLAFDSGSATPTANSIKQLDNALAGKDYVAKNVLNQGRPTKICVYGSTDTVGSEAENVRLSQRRAQWVADYMIKAGVASDRLVVRGDGSAKAIIRTPPNTPEPQNRNVLVYWLDCPQN